MNLSDIPKQTQKKILLAMIAALLVIGLLYLVAFPMLRNRRAQKDELLLLTDKIERANKLIDQKSDLQEMLQAKTDTLATIASQMIPPSENAFLWAAERLAAHGRRAGIEIDSVNEVAVDTLSWDSGSNKEGRSTRRYFIPYQVKIDFRAGYADLKKIIATIEGENRFASIASLAISSESSTPAVHGISMIVEWPLPGKTVDNSIADILEHGLLDKDGGGR